MTSNASPRPAVRILRLPDVCQITGFKRSMIYQLQAENRFPRSVKLGIRAVGWLEHEVQAWLTARVNDSRMPPGEVPLLKVPKPPGRQRGR
jgi:prophage regulatory protein